MKPAAGHGPILRRLGLLIEITCLLALVTQGDERLGQEVAGIALRHLLIAGVAVGAALCAFGLNLILRSARRARAVKSQEQA